jgi:hypothetical protein
MAHKGHKNHFFLFCFGQNCFIKSTLQENNFDPNFLPTHKAKASAYGNGIYFSEFPSIGMSYGTLILCKVLPGRVQVP